jgi:hypothetical protein
LNPRRFVMPVLFFFSISAAAVTFTLFYTWCIQKPFLYVSRSFQGQETPEDTSLGEFDKLPPAVLPLVWYPLKVVLFLGETYIQAAWGAYCVLRVFRAMGEAGLERGMVYHVAAFAACIGALGYIARSEKRKDILTVIQSCIAMGSYIVFVLNRGAIAAYYPWLVSYFSK